MIVGLDGALGSYVHTSTSIDLLEPFTRTLPAQFLDKKTEQANSNLSRLPMDVIRGCSPVLSGLCAYSTLTTKGGTIKKEWRNGEASSPSHASITRTKSLVRGAATPETSDSGYKTFSA